MPERRICSFSHEEIEPGTGMMYVKRDGSVMWFRDSKVRKNALKLKRNPNCPLCGDNPSVTELIDYEIFCGITEDTPTMS